MNNCVYQMPKLFPEPGSENLVIIVNSVGDAKEFSCLIADCLVDLHCVGTSQCFPLYYYENSARRDAISEHALTQCKNLYGHKVEKTDIFFYVYGILHSPEYRTKFGADLKKSLPRVPLAMHEDAFWKFSTAGRRLAKLHLDYENMPGLDNVVVEGNLKNLKVEKMRFADRTRRDTIIYNPTTTIHNIPTRVYDYIISGQSAVEWVMEKYQVKIDKTTSIANDPNTWIQESGKPDYILQLLLSVIAISDQTIQITSQL
jgi:predicted helicase